MSHHHHYLIYSLYPLQLFQEIFYWFIYFLPDLNHYQPSISPTPTLPLIGDVLKLAKILSALLSLHVISSWIYFAATCSINSWNSATFVIILFFCTYGECLCLCMCVSVCYSWSHWLLVQIVNFIITADSQIVSHSCSILYHK